MLDILRSTHPVDRAVRTTSRTVTISTDGAFAPIGKQKKGQTGPGEFKQIIGRGTPMLLK